jgi:selenocysteine lyase/cysteine desulfurase
MNCLRHLYSLPDEVRYLNNAYQSPMSKRVQEAGRDAIARLGNPSTLSSSDFFEPADALRRAFASLIGSSDWESVAFIPAASYGMATVATNVPLKPQQNVVILGEQFPSNVYVWRRVCKERNAVLRTVAPPESGRDRGLRWNESLLDAIDSDTAVVSIPNIHWSDGTLFDLDAIGARCRDVGSIFIVDGTQSVGALPLNVNELGIDALVCAAYKSLTGPYGLGLAYYGPRFHTANPIEDNWIVRAGSEMFAGLVNYVDEFQPGAKRLDMGGYSSFTLLPMLATAVDQVSEWTPEGIQSYCRGLTDALAESAEALGYVVEDRSHRVGHIVGLRMPAGINTELIRNRLQEQNIFVSIRGQALRVAPHVYSRMADIEALVDVLEASLA